MKLGFKDWRNPKQKFRQSSVVFEKPDIFYEKLKTLTSSNYCRFEYFLLKYSICFSLITVYKRVFLIIFIFFRSRVICESKKIWLLHTETRVFITFLLITQDLNKIKKTLKALVDIVRKKTCAKFQQKNRLYASWSLQKFSIFQTINLACQKI